MQQADAPKYAFLFLILFERFTVELIFQSEITFLHNRENKNSDSRTDFAFKI